MIPIIVFEDKNPIEALKKSKELIGKTWGEQLIGMSSFGLMTLIFGIPAVVIVFLLSSGGNSRNILISVGIVVIYLSLLGLIQSALQSIFQVAVL